MNEKLTLVCADWEMNEDNAKAIVEGRISRFQDLTLIQSASLKREAKAFLAGLVAEREKNARLEENITKHIDVVVKQSDSIEKLKDALARRDEVVKKLTATFKYILEDINSAEVSRKDLIESIEEQAEEALYAAKKLQERA